MAFTDKLSFYLGKEIPENIEFYIARNRSEGAIEQSKEVASGWANITFRNISNFFTEKEDSQTDNLFQKGKDGGELDSIFFNYDEEDFQYQKKLYEKLIREGKRILVISHSQGNIYTDQIYNRVILPNNYQDKFHMVSIASPVKTGDHTIFDALDGVGYLSLFSNTPNTFNGMPGHSFRFYLNGWSSGPKFEEYVNSAIENFSYKSQISDGDVYRFTASMPSDMSMYFIENAEVDGDITLRAIGEPVSFIRSNYNYLLGKGSYARTQNKVVYSLPCNVLGEEDITDYAKYHVNAHFYFNQEPINHDAEGNPIWNSAPNSKFVTFTEYSAFNNERTRTVEVSNYYYNKYAAEHWDQELLEPDTWSVFDMLQMPDDSIYGGEMWNFGHN